MNEDYVIILNDCMELAIENRKKKINNISDIRNKAKEIKQVRAWNDIYLNNFENSRADILVSEFMDKNNIPLTKEQYKKVIQETISTFEEWLKKEQYKISGQL